MDDINKKRAAVQEDSEECLEEVKNIKIVLPGQKELVVAQLTARHNELVQRIKSNDAEDAKLRQRHNEVNERQNELLNKLKDSENFLWPLLDGLLAKIGVLPDVNRNERNPRARIFDENDFRTDWYWSENNWNDVDPNEWKNEQVEVNDTMIVDPRQQEDPENTWNNAWKDYQVDNPLISVQDMLHRTAEEVNRVELEFENIRERYDYELKGYSLQQKENDVGEQEIIEQLEEEFGPIWLRKCQDISRRRKEAGEAHWQAEQALSDANLREHEIKAAKLEAEVRPLVQEPTVAPQPLGILLPPRKRRWIDEWREGVAIGLVDENAQRPTGVQDNDVSMPTNIVSDSMSAGRVDSARAEGYTRRKIDRYIRRNEEKRPDTCDDTMQKMHIAWAQKMEEDAEYPILLSIAGGPMHQYD